jgi:hypothetical protein
MKAEPKLTTWLRGGSVGMFSLYAVGTAFTTYFCMYAFRKPFAVAEYAGFTMGPLGLKSVLIISQVCGYALSKVLGIKFVSEARPEQRKWALIALIIWAELALVLFAVLPPAGKVVALFLNGLPLGAVWGLVFSFLEGRRTSELLGAGLSASYIVASGAVKTVGKLLMNLGIGEFWMPATTGLLFLPLFLLMVYMLSCIPPPTAADIEARTEREPMNKEQRRAFLKQFALGLVLLTFLYLFLTAYRDFRDNFAAELWRELGNTEGSSIFTLTELPIAFGVMAVLALLYKVRDNRKGLIAAHGIMAGGTILVGLSTLAFDMGVIGPVPWMVLIGLGLYLAYVPYGCVLFDRLIAAMGVVATAVFMIYVTDAVGYIGSIGVLIYQQLWFADQSVLGFFRAFSYLTSVLCTLCFLGSWAYFNKQARVQG